MKALPAPQGRRTTVNWGTKLIPANKADGSHYRISGMTRSGKSHLTKLFILEILPEIESNPHAKLVVYDPKREFYAWLRTVKERRGLASKLTYFMPSDKRSVGLDFTNDYRSLQDSVTFANAFCPPIPNDQNPFWGQASRAIYSAVFHTIRKEYGRVDLRLLCLVLENDAFLREVLERDAYQVQARKLVEPPKSGRGETFESLMYTIHSRIAEMKVLAAHLDRNSRKNGVFSIREFVKEADSGILVVSKDEDYSSIQDPTNGVFFLRLMQLLDKQQRDPRRRVFIVLDEFPTLAGDVPCPGMKGMFTRLASRGVNILITYQGHKVLTDVYGEQTAGIIGQCSNVIYLKQPDPESAEHAERDLGAERGREAVSGTSHGKDGMTINHQKEWYDRARITTTDLQDLPLASPALGVEGRAKSGQYQEQGPWSFTYHPEFINQRIPESDDEIKEYEEWEDEAQRLEPLSDDEKRDLKLIKQPQTSAERDRNFEILLDNA